MAININGDTGISGIDGSATTPAIQGTDTNTGLTFGTDTVSVVTSGNTRATVGSSGQVGIGTSTASNVTGTMLTINRASAAYTQYNQGTSGGALVGTEGEDVVFYTYTGAIGSESTAKRGEFDSAGNFLFNSGYGSVATAFGCRAWVNFDGQSGSIGSGRANGNISSIDDNGTGQYTVNFTNSFPDNDYAPAAFVRADSGGGLRACVGRGTTGFANGSIQIEVRNASNSLEDPDTACLAFFR